MQQKGLLVLIILSCATGTFNDPNISQNASKSCLEYFQANILEENSSLYYFTPFVHHILL